MGNDSGNSVSLLVGVGAACVSHRECYLVSWHSLCSGGVCTCAAGYHQKQGLCSLTPTLPSWTVADAQHQRSSSGDEIMYRVVFLMIFSALFGCCLKGYLQGSGLCGDDDIEDDEETPCSTPHGGRASSGPGANQTSSRPGNTAAYRSFTPFQPDLGETPSRPGTTNSAVLRPFTPFYPDQSLGPTPHGRHNSVHNISYGDRRPSPSPTRTRSSRYSMDYGLSYTNSLGRHSGRGNILSWLVPDQGAGIRRSYSDRRAAGTRDRGHTGPFSPQVYVPPRTEPSRAPSEVDAAADNTRGDEGRSTDVPPTYSEIMTAPQDDSLDLPSYEEAVRISS